ncbi:MAG: phytoene desaturase family protein [Gammaproteobacteria bacterium]
MIGAGHNALVAAALLARAGKSVIVLERLSSVGGSVATTEILPGFRAPQCFSGVELFHPRLTRTLELEKHGLRLLDARGGSSIAQADGAWLNLGHSEARDLASLTATDRDALVEFERFTTALTGALAPLQTAPLPQLDPDRLAGKLDILRHALRLRRLGVRDMGEALRFLPMPIQDVLDERFESDALKAALAAPALTAAWLGPRSAGSAWGLLHHRPAWCGGLFLPKRFAAGGPGSLSAALAASATAHGAKIRTDARVVSIKVHDGNARGVLLEDGGEIVSRKVISGVDPRTTLLDLVGAQWLEPEIVRAVRNLRAHGSVAIVRFALSRRPRFHGAPDSDAHLAGRIQIGSTLEYMERAFDAAKYGRAPDKPCLELTLPSIVDKSLAPPGKQVMHVWVQYAARDLRESDWVGERDRLVATVTGLIDQHAADFSASIVHADVLTPLDIEQQFGLTGGCLYHADLTLDQLLYMRPLPGWYRYRTPIDNLYLCGAGTHPGGGVTGLPGKNAAFQVLEDWRSRGD